MEHFFRTIMKAGMGVTLKYTNLFKCNKLTHLALAKFHLAF